MNNRLTEAEDVFLGKVNQICNKFGLNNIMAQLYAILYLSNNPMSLNDMVERLKISKGSVSINIRALERYGAVRKVWVKGSRRDYYTAETDISKVIMDRIKTMAQRRLSEVDDMVTSSYHALNSISSSSKEEKEAIKQFKEKLHKLKNTFFTPLENGDSFHTGPDMDYKNKYPELFRNPLTKVYADGGVECLKGFSGAGTSEPSYACELYIPSTNSKVKFYPRIKNKDLIIEVNTHEMDHQFIAHFGFTHRFIMELRFTHGWG